MVSTQVEYISHAAGRRGRRVQDAAADDAARQLQNLNVLLFLRVSGTCRGCQANPFFTNQIVGRKKHRRDRRLFDNPISTNSMRAGVPTEAKTLRAFSNILRSSLVRSILDAVSKPNLGLLEKP